MIHRTNQSERVIKVNMKESHVDDDVVTFMFLSQSDLQVSITDQTHVLLQHLSINQHIC